VTNDNKYKNSGVHLNVNGATKRSAYNNDAGGDAGTLNGFFPFISLLDTKYHLKAVKKGEPLKPKIQFTALKQIV
jgi:hypothetical protein